MFNREGGVDQAEAYFNVLLDRVGTTSDCVVGKPRWPAPVATTTNMILSHKRTSISSTRTSGTASFFPQGPKEVGEEKWFEPEIQVPSQDQSKKLAAWGNEVALAKSELQNRFKALEPDYVAWQQKAKTTVWQSLVPTSVDTSSGEKAVIEADGTVSLFTKTPQLSYTLT